MIKLIITNKTKPYDHFQNKNGDNKNRLKRNKVIKRYNQEFFFCHNIHTNRNNKLKKIKRMKIMIMIIAKI